MKVNECLQEGLSSNLNDAEAFDFLHSDNNSSSSSCSVRLWRWLEFQIYNIYTCIAIQKYKDM